VALTDGTVYAEHISVKTANCSAHTTILTT